MNSHKAADSLVEELLAARDLGRLASTPAQLGFHLNLADAYQVGRRLHDRLVGRGHRPIGRKIGFTNRALWEQFQVSEPIWAPMYAQTVHFAQDCRHKLSPAGMVAPRLEPEIVLKLRTPVPRDEPSALELARYIEWAAVGFEIVDCHFPDWRITAAEAVADFGVHRALVVGTPWQVTSENPSQVAAQLEALQVSLQGGAGFAAIGEGRNALGSPLLALGFLARVIASQSWAPQMAPGEVITTGTLTALPHLRPGESYRVDVIGAPLAPLQLDLDA